MSSPRGYHAAVRRARLGGWSIEAIARCWHLTRSEVAAALSSPLPRPRAPRAARWRDAWRGDGWRYRDDVGPDGLIELCPPASVAAEASAAAIAAELPPAPAPSAWSGPASPCASSLPGGRRRIRG